nr:uncharacterized protein LOC109179093 [Ipomoea batatas]
MELKVDESSGEICGNNAMHFSANDVSPSSKNGKGEAWGNCETNNLISINSSYDSSSANSEHKVCARTSDVSATSDGTAPTLEAPKALEEYDDSIPSVTRGGEANKISKLNEEESINLPCAVNLAEESIKHPKDHLNLVVKDEVAPGNGGNPLDDACITGKREGLDKVMHSSVLPDTHANSSETHANNGSDDSDIEEHDVKVCDICGDAGREDLLAICCRCTDGAEHTYCMREMLEKVPEGDWLCEECKSEKEIENQKQYKTGRAGGNENGYSSGQTAITNSEHHETETKASDFVGGTAVKECSQGKVSSTRNTYDSEAISAAKKQVLEPLSGSPKAESPNRVPMLSRESSFKNLEKGKVKPVHQFGVVNDSSASGPRMQTSRGTFSKSNSFSSLIAKPKVKLVDEVFPAKQKLSRETAFIESKDVAVRSMGKSMSFKPTTASRSNCTESKVKMFSPKFSHDQDVKWLRHKKDRSSFDRKNSLRSDRLAGGAISSPKSDNKPTPRGEPSSLSSLNTNRDYRALISENKPVTISNSTSGVAREVLKQASVDGVSSANRISSSEENPSQAIPKEDSSSSSCVAERPSWSSNEVLPDGLSQSKESKAFGDKTRESSASRSKQNSTASGKIVSCQKCKGNGHLAQVCTADGPESSALGSPFKSSREATNGPSDLKAAIEAARLRKPGICRKNRVADQSEDLSASNMKSEIASQDQMLSSTVRRNVNGAEEAQKQETANNAKQLGIISEASARTRDAGHVAFSDVKHSVIDMERQTLVSMPVILKTAIPEYQYIWQGGFEVQKSGKAFNLYDGIQAHLSSCASPKVLDAVNKFPWKVILNEVPRLSSWPMQFKECGVSEDNIALFFFAKDIGSYEKSYKVLLGNMVKHDLALQGNIGDIELLIFPSNHLPEKFQRWNLMFFLWGVFRGKRANSLQNFPGAEKPLIQDILTAATSLPENMFTPVPKLNSVLGSAATNIEMSALKEPESASSHKIVNGNCSIQSSPQVSRDKCSRINTEQNDKLDSSSIQNSEPKLGPDRRYFGVPLVEAVHSSVQTAERVSSPNTSRPMSVHWAAQLDGEKLSMLSDETPTMQEATSVGSTTKNLCGKDDVKIGHICLDNVSTEEGTPLARHTSMEQTLNVISSFGVNPKKRSHSAETVLQSASSSGTSQAFSSYSNDDILVEECCHKRVKPNFDRSYGCNDQTSCSKDGFLSEMGGGGTASQLSRQKNERDEALSKTAILETPGNAEMFFFPVDPHPVDNNSSMPWKVHPLEEDQLRDKAPNLELALGAKTKPLMSGIPSFLSGKVEKKIIEENTSDNAAASANKEDVSASLSLSLSFPFPEKEQGTSASKPEQEDPRRRQANTSLLLFGRPEG